MALGCIILALYDKANKEGDSFVRGSMKIIDPDNRLLDLLNGYVQFATGHKSPGFTRLYGANEFAYSRDPNYSLSSHYKDKKYESIQYGIDARFQVDGNLIDLFPDNRGHLLFGSVNIQGKTHTFIKIERIGLGNLKEYVEHGTHFLHPSEPNATDRRESEIPETISKTFENFLLNLNQVDPTNQALKKARFDINEMYLLVRSHSVLDSSLMDAATPFYEALNHLNFMKDIESRTGNEVVFNLNSFVKPTCDFKTLSFSALNFKHMRAAQEVEFDYKSTHRAAPCA